MQGKEKETLTRQPPIPPQQYPEPSQATTALVLGILGIMCFITALFAWYFGTREVKAMDQGRRNPANRGTGTAGKVLGIVGTILGSLLLVFFVGLPILVLIAGSEVSDTFSEIGSSLD